MREKLRLLYVDDESDIRDIVEMALEDEMDLELRLCASGAEALALLPQYRADLLLLDVMMPGLDGPTTLKRLRELPGGETAPAIFVTAKVQPREVEQFKALGAIGVIAKPFDPMTLADQVRTLWAQTVATVAPDPVQQDKFQPLRDAYGAALPQRIAEICDGWDRIERGAGEAADWHRFQSLVHTLAGSAGTFGFHALGEQARKLEDFLLAPEDCTKDKRAASIERRLATLRSLAEKP